MKGQKIQKDEVYKKTKDGLTTFLKNEEVIVDTVEKTTVVVRSSGNTHRIAKRCFVKEFTKILDAKPLPHVDIIQAADLVIGTKIRYVKETEDLPNFTKDQVFIITKVTQHRTKLGYYIASDYSVYGVGLDAIQKYFVLDTPETKGLATAIRETARGFGLLRKSGLSDKTIVLLLHDMTKVSKTDIKRIIEAVPKMESEYLEVKS